MAVKNITEVRLLNVPLEKDYKHTIYFEGKAGQQSYFKSKTIHTITESSYQRKDNIIRVPIHIDQLYNCNYVMYKNTAYTDKWFYAFITDMEYKDDGRTDIHIQTDVLQTWQFDYTVLPSFVEREHVTDDTIGLHTVPEQLETGEYVCNGSEVYDGFEECGIVLASTVALGDRLKGSEPCLPVVGGNYNNIFSGLRYYYFDINYTGELVGGIDALNYVIQKLADKGQSDAIVSLFIAPKTYLDIGENVVITDTGEKSVLLQPLVGSDTAKIKIWNFDKPTKLVNYTPVNNKLYCYPYSYLMLSNHNGGNVTYQYELFNTMSMCTFRVNGAVTPGCSIRLFPTNYANEFINYEEGITAGKFPICNWNTDVYTNWLTQNSVNIGLSVGNAMLQTIAGVGGSLGNMAVGIGTGFGGSVGGLANSIASGVSGITSSIGEMYRHSLIPAQAEGNLNSGDVCFASGNLTFKAYHKCIRPEFAKIIDGYFTMFGYKVNEMKVPNKDHRANFWYTKTIDVNIDGAIPNKDLQQIKACYDNGITFWRSGVTVGDYSVGNPIP